MKKLMAIILSAAVLVLAMSCSGESETVVDRTANYYSVNYSTEYGSEPGGKLLKKGTLLDEKSLPALKQEGFLFEGWYSDDTKIESGYAIKSDITLKAKWSRNSYTVTFKSNGGTGEDYTQTFEYDIPGKLDANKFSAPVGLYFNFWSKSDTASGSEYYVDEADFTIGAGDVVLYAIWSENEPHKISYENIEGIENPNSVTYLESKNVTLLPVEKTGYIFEGWFESGRFEGVAVEEWNAGDKTKDVVLFAKLTPITYSIVFEANGAGGKMSVQRVSYDDEEELTDNVFSGAGLSFLKWNTKADGTGTSYADGAKIMNLSDVNGDEIKLYALWNYAINYNLNGGTNSNKNPESYNILSEEITLEDPSLNNKDFAGWFTTSDFEETSYVNKIETGSTGVITLYAKWIPVKYGIAYILNDKESSPAVNTNPEFFDVESARIELAAPVRPGCTFDGWYANENLIGTKVTEIPAGSTGNRALWAKWILKEYSITYKLGTFGTLTEGTRTTFNVEDEFDLTVPACEEKHFAGWYTDEACSDENLVEKLAEGTAENLTLWAKWVAIPYAINYVFNDNANSTAVNNEENPAVYTADDTIVLKSPSREGYSFEGWYSDSACSVPVTSISGAGAKTVYAKWSVVEYDISYDDSFDYVNSFLNPSKYTVESSITLKAPSRTGYSFVEWKEIMADGSSVAVTGIEPGNTGAKTFSPVFTPVEYTITYNLNNGVNNEANPSTFTIESETITLASPVRTGCTFDGWYERDDYSGVAVTKIATGSTGNKTLYAKWATNGVLISVSAPQVPGDLVIPEPVNTGYSLRFSVPAGISYLGDYDCQWFVDGETTEHGFGASFNLFTYDIDAGTHTIYLEVKLTDGSIKSGSIVITINK